MSELLPSEPTGEDLVRAIGRAAELRGLSLTDFARALSTRPDKWLAQTAIGQKPRQRTVDRVRALLTRQEVLPPLSYPSNGPRSPSMVRAAGVKDPPIPADFEPIDREPCWRCGVRGEVGCQHRPWPPG